MPPRHPHESGGGAGSGEKGEKWEKLGRKCLGFAEGKKRKERDRRMTAVCWIQHQKPRRQQKKTRTGRRQNKDPLCQGRGQRGEGDGRRGRKREPCVRRGVTAQEPRRTADQSSKTTNSITKRAKDSNRRFSDVDTRTSNEHVRRCSTSLIITQNDSTVRQHLTPVRTAATGRTEPSVGRTGAAGPPRPAGGNGAGVLETRDPGLPDGPATPLLGTWLKSLRAGARTEVCAHVHSGVSHSSLRGDAAPSVHRRTTEEQDAVHAERGIRSGLKEEGSSDACHVDAP